MSAVLTQSNAEETATANAEQIKTTINNNLKGCVHVSHPFSTKRGLALGNNTKFTFAQIRYIVCLYRLSKDGYGVKNVELSKALGFSKPSVHNMLKSLEDLGVVRQEAFRLAFLTDKGLILAQKYAVCYEKLENKMTELYGSGTASENAICGLLADMPTDKLNELYNGN